MSKMQPLVVIDDYQKAEENMNKPFIGIEKNEIDTPALLIDLDMMDANIAAMADFFDKVDARLRPHVKTHKSPIIAHKQIDYGAMGVTCAKLGEAEVMVNAGIKDVLIANQIVGRTKIARLVNLAKHGFLMVAVDNAENVADLAAAAAAKDVNLWALVEVDIGMERCGVPPGKPALELAQQVVKSDGLRFAGLMGYEGHAVMITDKEERRKVANSSIDMLVKTKELLNKNGINVEIMSGGGTGTYDITGSRWEMREIQAGSYVFMDAKYSTVSGLSEKFGYALTILTTVISRPEPDLIITDAGMKVMTKEFGIPQPINIDGLEQVSLSEEHGKLIAHKDTVLKVGDKIELLPTHGCTTINLHDNYYAVRDGKLEAVWKVEARGRSI